MAPMRFCATVMGEGDGAGAVAGAGNSIGAADFSFTGAIIAGGGKYIDVGAGAGLGAGICCA